MPNARSTTLSPTLPGTLAQALGVPLALAGIVLGGAALRFAALTGQSFWYDEAVSALLARGSVHDLATGRLRDLGNPPLHALLLHGWSLLFGSGDAALRALSATAGVLAIPLLFSIARRLAGERVALAAAALLAFEPFQVYLAQEARAFALATLLALLTVETLQRATRNPEATRWWAAHAASAFALAWTHYFGFFLLLGELAAVAARRDRRLLRRHVAALVAAALAYAIWIPAFVAQLTAKGNLARSPESWWMQALATPLVYAIGTTLVWKDALSAARLALAAAGTLGALVAFAAGLRATWRDREFGLVRAWLAAPILLPLAISALSPLYNVRYVALASPAFLLVAAAGLAALGPRARALCTAAWVAASAASLGFYYGAPVKHDWRSAVASLEASAGRHDLLLFDADVNETAYARYAAGPQERLRILPAPGGSRADDLYGVAAAGERVQDVTARVASARRVWLVLSDVEPSSGRQLARFFSGWKVVAQRRYRGIEVVEYQR